MNGINLKHMSEIEILVHSKALSGQSNADLAEGMDLGEETVARYLRCPQDGERVYGLPIGRLRGWNRAAKNKVVLHWLCQREGGVFVEVDGIGLRKEDVAARVGRLNKETAEAIAALIDMLTTGTASQPGLEQIEKELMDVRQEVEGAIIAVRGRMALA